MLRPWRRGDAAAIVECLDGDPEISRWLDQVPQPYSRADALAYIGGIGESAFAVTDAASGKVLGSIGVQFSEEGDVGEIGYWLRAEARGGGVTTRALVLLSRWALGRDGVARVQLRADPENGGRATQRALERAPRATPGLGDVLASARRARVIPVIDGHNDALLRVWRHGGSLRERAEDGHLDLPRMREGGIAAGR